MDGNQEGDDHRIGEVVKTIEVKNGTILSRKVRYYKEENENIVPELIREDFPTGIKDTNIIFDKYDQYGNIIEYHKNNDYHTSRIWGYNYTYPILEAQNVSYDEIIDQLGENTLELLQGNSLSDKQIRDELGTLRSSFPQAQFTIYTYDPLVGMTSETDPAGKTKYYEYDAFGRLKTIKDHNQHIVKQFDYNYK